MPRRTKSVPSYRKHRASGQAILTLSGRDFYLGPHGSLASRVEYDRLIAEWLANGRRSLDRDQGNQDVTVNELILAYWKHVEQYYVKNGEPTSEQSNIRQSLRWLSRLYGSTPANEFGPLALKAVRQLMINDGRARKTINNDVARLKQVFRWGVENELVAPDVYHALRTVPSLKKGRSAARETNPVKPVDNRLVNAVKTHVSRQVWAMIQLQKSTGMRSGEVAIMRACDIDMDGKVWSYRPSTHKTSHHGHERVVELGPQAQKVVSEFLKLDPAACLFSPVDAESERRAEQHRRRRTPIHHGNRPGTNRKKKPLHTPRQRYTRDSYRRAIERAIKKAFPHPVLSSIPKADLTEDQQRELKAWHREHHWHPHQLRHSFATRVRKEYGLEAAKILLGQSTIAAAEIYAEAERSRAAEIAAKIG